MIENILFVQPFGLKKEHLTDEILIWEVYLENYLKCKIPSLIFDLLYLPVEQEKGKITISSFKEVDLFENQMIELISELKFKPDKSTLICISGTTSQHFLSSKYIGEYFQKYYPTAIIVFGGAHASARPNDFSYKNSPIDYIVIGEGEVPLYNLAKDSASKHDVPVIIKSKPISDLNDLPELDFSIFDKYINDFKHLSISLSRGCPFNCHFCMEKGLSKGRTLKSWRAYNPERAIQEVANMVKYGSEHGIKAYGFYDPIFGMNKKWLNDFLDHYNFGNLTSTWIETRLDILNEELLKKLDRNNFNTMYGLESFSKEMLTIMNKTTNPTAYLKKFDDIFEIHERSSRFFMINVLCNHPGETKKSYEVTFNRLKKMIVDDEIDPITFNIRFYHHFPGTRIYNDFNYFNEKHGSIAYFPEWYKDERLLEFGPYCVRPSSGMSLRESYKTYTVSYQELLREYIQKMKDKEKSSDIIGKVLIAKGQIRALDEKMNKFFKFLDDNRIESVNNTENELKKQVIEYLISKGEIRAALLHKLEKRFCKKKSKLRVKKKELISCLLSMLREKRIEIIVPELFQIHWEEEFKKSLKYLKDGKYFTRQNVDLEKDSIKKSDYYFDSRDKSFKNQASFIRIEDEIRNLLKKFPEINQKMIIYYPIGSKPINIYEKLKGHYNLNFKDFQIPPCIKEAPKIEIPIEQQKENLSIIKGYRNNFMCFYITLIESIQKMIIDIQEDQHKNKTNDDVIKSIIIKFAYYCIMYVKSEWVNIKESNPYRWETFFKFFEIPFKILKLDFESIKFHGNTFETWGKFKYCFFLDRSCNVMIKELKEIGYQEFNDYNNANLVSIGLDLDIYMPCPSIEHFYFAIKYIVYYHLFLLFNHSFSYINESRSRIKFTSKERDLYSIFLPVMTPLFGVKNGKLNYKLVFQYYTLDSDELETIYNHYLVRNVKKIEKKLYTYFLLKNFHEK